MDPSSESLSKPRFLERIKRFLFPKPLNREELVDTLHNAFEQRLLDSDALSMIEGAMQVSDLQARDIMVHRNQMDVIDIEDNPETVVPFVIETGHSRFPVIDGSRDNIVGILLAKELLRYHLDLSLRIADMVRPAIFIPETKRLNVLLKEFRNRRNHMAIVVDEYGNTAGLVTIEDVMEQIVGDIEDEYDLSDTEENNIVEDADGNWRIKASMFLSDLNETIGSHFEGEENQTVGDFLLNLFGYLPKRGDVMAVDHYLFRVLKADSRSIQSLFLYPAPSNHLDDTED